MAYHVRGMKKISHYKFIKFIAFMSLGYELATFTSSFKFIKFITQARMDPVRSFGTIQLNY